MGLLVGLALNFVATNPRTHQGLDFTSKTCLRWGIVILSLQVTLAQITIDCHSVSVEAPHFEVALQPGAGEALAIGIRRYAHQPTSAFLGTRGVGMPGLSGDEFALVWQHRLQSC